MVNNDSAKMMPSSGTRHHYSCPSWWDCVILLLLGLASNFKHFCDCRFLAWGGGEGRWGARKERHRKVKETVRIVLSGEMPKKEELEIVLPAGFCRI